MVRSIYRVARQLLWVPKLLLLSMLKLQIVLITKEEKRPGGITKRLVVSRVSYPSVLLIGVFRQPFLVSPYPWPISDSGVSMTLQRTEKKDPRKGVGASFDLHTNRCTLSRSITLPRSLPVSMYSMRHPRRREQNGETLWLTPRV